MPISAATFRPYIGEIIDSDYLKPGAGGYNTIISTADRKLNIYSGTQFISSVPTENLHTVVRTAH